MIARLLALVPAFGGILASALCAAGGLVLLRTHPRMAAALLFASWSLLSALAIAVSLSLRGPTRIRGRSRV